MASSEFSLSEHIDEIHGLLKKFQVEQHLIEIGSGPRLSLEHALIKRQQGVELERHLKPFHVADLATLLQTLPARGRQLIWRHIEEKRRGHVLLELPDAVAEGIVQDLSDEELLPVLQHLDADDLILLRGALPPALFDAARAALDQRQREWLRTSLEFSEHQVGHRMDLDLLVANIGQTVASILDMLRKLDSMPGLTDKLYVVDDRGHLVGAVFLHDLLIHPATDKVNNIMKTRVVTFTAADDLTEAARAFDRYDLVSAPVLNERGKLIGRITINDVMDYMREAAEMDALNVAGVVEGEDPFANVWTSAKNRWLWLAINLFSAFVISRIIGMFEDTISQLVALAALMPIIASVAGNTGNQTAAIVIRSLALEQIHSDNLRHFFSKELAISVLNGLVWGVAVGIFAYVFYGNFALSAVVSFAMMLSFLLAAVIGVGTPVLLEKIGRDPAMGSSVILTGTIDAMGFLVFLLLANLLLV